MFVAVHIVDVFCQLHSHCYKKMQQKTIQGTPRPNPIRLQPFSLLPQLRPYSLTSPTNSSEPFSYPKAKIKTQASSQSKQKRGRMKTEPNLMDKQESSPSFRLISRFIYNHLQKKINFQTQLYKNYQNAYPTYHSSASQQQQGLDLLPIRGSRYQYGYQRYNPSIKDSNHTQILKFKNKLTLRQKIMQRNHEKSPSAKHRYANIDSYFDLSCLDTCTPKEEHSF